ncbi:hypothetical protein BsWGS_10113 [Bradybaena similaris]
MEVNASSPRTRPTADEAKFGIQFFKRFWKLCRFMFPSCCCPSIWLTLFLLLLCFLEQVVIYFIGLVPSKFYKIFLDKDEPGFKSHAAYSIGLIVAEAFLLSLKSYVASFLYITWRKSICSAIHNQYFSDILYYRLNVTDKTIDNPDQRITQDVDGMCKTFSLVLVPIIITPFKTCYYIYKCWTVTSYLGPVSTIVFFIIFTVINKLLMSPVSRYVYLQEKMEGNFRFQHMQIRVNAESAAFYQAEDIEKLKANQKLDKLLSTQRRLIAWQFPLNSCINVADYFGSILSYIAISFPIFSGKYDGLSPGDLSSLISQNGFYAIYLVNCFTTLIDQSAQVTNVIGTTHRIGQLFEELERLKGDELEKCVTSTPETECLINARGDYRSLEANDAAAFEVQKLTYGQPKSCNILCKNLTFQLTSGTNILVTGDSGCGKTSLLRILSGLWKPVSGIISQNVHLGPTGMFYLPQKPYFTDGTLREQIVYPLQVCDVASDDHKIEDYLKIVRLTHLLNRLGGLDAETDWNWYDQLSPGEMQRLSFVRLFFHQSPYAILDEATSQVSEEMEQQLYKTCFDLKITILSIGHRSTIRPYHEMELRILSDGQWSLSPIVPHLSSTLP